MRFNKLVRTSLLVVALSLICPRATLSQSVKKLTAEDGLPQSYVSALVQDKDGFMWVGTRNGLARYDGAAFKIFQHKPADSSFYSFKPYHLD